MIDFGWFYAIVEASAAFVAIVSAFFTTKILSIASEKRQISFSVEALENEIAQRKQLAGSYQEEIDSIGFKWAKREVDPFLEEVLYEVDPENPPSKEDLLKLFEKEESRPPNDYEKELIEKKYTEFLERVRAIAEQREAERRAIEKNPFAGLGALFELSKSMRHLRLYDLRPPGVAMREAERLDEVMDKFLEEDSGIKILESQKKDCETRLKALYFPKYLTWGFISLIYFVIVGIAMPLAFILWNETLRNYVAEFHIFILFLSGLTGTLIYLYLEVQQALKQP